MAAQTRTKISKFKLTRAESSTAPLLPHLRHGSTSICIHYHRCAGHLVSFSFLFFFLVFAVIRVQSVSACQRVHALASNQVSLFFFFFLFLYTDSRPHRSHPHATHPHPNTSAPSAPYPSTFTMHIQDLYLVGFLFSFFSFLLSFFVSSVIRVHTPMRLHATQLHAHVPVLFCFFFILICVYR